MSELELVGKTVVLRNVAPGDQIKDGDHFTIEDAAPVVFDQAVYKAAAAGNHAAQNFQKRAVSWWDLNHSYYGHRVSDGLGFIVHISEIGDVVG